MNLEIQSLVFVLQSSPPKLIPGKIIEQIISRKIDGEHIKHVVEFSSRKTFILEELKKPWFPSLNSAKLYLEDEAEKLVATVINEAVSTSERLFGTKPDTGFSEQEISITKKIEQKSIDEEEVYVDIGDGQQARVKLPEILKKK